LTNPLMKFSKGPLLLPGLKSRRRKALLVALHLFWLLLTALQGCSSVPAGAQQAELPGLSIDGMVIRNELPYPVTDVLIDVPATGAFAGCGNILPGSDCRTSFETRDYQYQALIIRWKEYGESHQTGEFVIDIPDELDRTRPAWLEVVIFARGQAGASLIQE